MYCGQPAVSIVRAARRTHRAPWSPRAGSASQGSKFVGVNDHVHEPLPLPPPLPLPLPLTLPLPLPLPPPLSVPLLSRLRFASPSALHDDAVVHMCAPMSHDRPDSDSTRGYRSKSRIRRSSACSRRERGYTNTRRTQGPPHHVSITCLDRYDHLGAGMPTGAGSSGQRATRCVPTTACGCRSWQHRRRTDRRARGRARNGQRRGPAGRVARSAST